MKVVFFPRNDYPNNIEICNHRLDKKMTYTEDTDVLPQRAIDYILPMAVTRGINTCVFASMEADTVLSEYVMTQINNNLLYPDVYFMPTRYAATDITEEEIDADYQRYLNWFLPIFGRKPVSFAYSVGNTSYSQFMMKYFLAGRNSGKNEYTDYGTGLGNPSNIPYSLSGYISKQSSFRWWDTARQNSDNFAVQIQAVADKIDETLLNGGWVNNFTHWHNVVDLDIDPITGEVREGREGLPSISAYDDYFAMLAQKNANNEIYFAGYGEAVAYLVYRESISKAVMYSPVGAENDKLIIRLEAKNVFNIDTDLLQVPISIKFSTTGTPLEGQTIRCDYNLISLGNNQYIVEIPYSEYAGAVIEKVSI